MAGLLLKRAIVSLQCHQTTSPCRSRVRGLCTHYIRSTPSAVAFNRLSGHLWAATVCAKARAAAGVLVATMQLQERCVSAPACVC